MLCPGIPQGLLTGHTKAAGGLYAGLYSLHHRQCVNIKKSYTHTNRELSHVRALGNDSFCIQVAHMPRIIHFVSRKFLEKANVGPVGQVVGAVGPVDRCQWPYNKLQLQRLSLKSHNFREG